MHPNKDFQEPKLLAAGQGNLFSLPCELLHAPLRNCLRGIVWAELTNMAWLVTAVTVAH